MLRTVERMLERLGLQINCVAPLGASPADIARLGEADFNIVLYPEVADTAARWLEKTFNQPRVTTVPIGVGATKDFIAEIAAVTGLNLSFDGEESRLPWYSRSVDSTYLTGKRVFVFGDATHALASARICVEELGFELVGLGTYSREFARDVRAEAEKHGLSALITDDYLEVERAMAEAHPELVLGTQMERHIAKRLGVPCAVISAPVHVQDFPARYSPQMGYEGANVIFDSWVHPLMMGLEEHLLGMFQDDFEFKNGAVASHLASEGAHAVSESEETTEGALEASAAKNSIWDLEAEKELKKIPFFVRGKARRNTESYAEAQGLSTITLETLYDAKAHFSR